MSFSLLILKSDAYLAILFQQCQISGKVPINNFREKTIDIYRVILYKFPTILTLLNQIQ